MAASNLVVVKSLLVQILRLAYLSFKKMPHYKKSQEEPLIMVANSVPGGNTLPLPR